MTGMITAKAAKLAVALLASVAVAAVAAGTASASPTGSSHSAASSNARSLSKFAKPEKWEYTFTGLNVGEWYGPVSCKGKHESNEKKGYLGTETSGGRDVEKCKSTTGKPLELVAPGEHVALGAGEFPGASGWSSDDPALAGLESKDIEYTVAANGKSFKLVAYY